ncbi:MAG: response regulator receiver modulated FAD-dependent pyridine nucleotide-disulfide oxidoreductase [Deltaproteobacteria bacterium]|jgi:DNA-binding NtrC family response regulator|nr:response regulator receiver modulated FAD-dependent pyridine nucleotide-disulfide oxidoreductase [Deltaproteobacteria bacterium]
MKSILVVEDETSLRESLREWLTDLGYHVESASEGEEALRLIEEKDFDVALFDLRLPGKSGLQVLREAKAKRPKLVGIIITAYPTTETAVEAMKMGAVDFVTKPLDLGRLETLVKAKTEPAKVGAKPLLVVDDEPSMRESLEHWFADLGYQVETAADGAEALKRLADKEYGLLILDLKLPKKDGIEVLRETRRLHPGLKVIIITAYPSVDTATEAMKQGAIEYLTKPFELSELEKLVAQSVEPTHVEMLEGPVTRHAVTAILKVLDRAAGDSRFLSRLAEAPGQALSDYPDLTDEEKEALIDGDIRTIESWVGKLDQQRSTWLWCRLGQEKW